MIEMIKFLWVNASTGWSFRRIIYLGMGILILIQAIGLAQWFGVLLGIYFALMGLLGFGCAGGNCKLPTLNSQSTDLIEPQKTK